MKNAWFSWLLVGLLGAVSGGIAVGILSRPEPVYAIGLSDVAPKERLWMAFKDFLEREQDEIRAFPQ